MGWANRVTLARAVLMVGVWIVLLWDAPAPRIASWWIAFVLFTITAGTDAVDGMIARRLGQVSIFGRIADPLVDKLMILGTMVVLLVLDGVPALLPAWVVVLMLTREFLVTALRGAVEGAGVNFQAVAWGKLKMFFQCIAVGAVLLHGAGFFLARVEVPLLADVLPGPAARWNLTHVLVWVAAILTAVSGISYTRRAARILTEGKGTSA